MSDAAPAPPKPPKPPKPRPKPPGARNPEHKPYRKGTQDEVDQRVNEVMVMLGNSYTKIDIHNAFRSLDARAKEKLAEGDPRRMMYDLHWRSVDRYIALARKELLKRSRRSKADILADAVAYWESVVKDHNSSRADRNFARRRLDEIYGVDAPKQVRVTTPPGQPIQIATEERPLIDVPTKRLRELAEGSIDVETEIVKENGKPKKTEETHEQRNTINEF